MTYSVFRVTVSLPLRAFRETLKEQNKKKTEQYVFCILSLKMEWSGDVTSTYHPHVCLMGWVGASNYTQSFESLSLFLTFQQLSIFFSLTSALYKLLAFRKAYSVSRMYRIRCYNLLNSFVKNNLYGVALGPGKPMNSHWIGIRKTLHIIFSNI